MIQHDGRNVKLENCLIFFALILSVYASIFCFYVKFSNEFCCLFLKRIRMSCDISVKHHEEEKKNAYLQVKLIKHSKLNYKEIQKVNCKDWSKNQNSKDKTDFSPKLDR